MITPAAAIADPSMLGNWFAGDSWATWRAVLRAAYAEPLDAADLARFRAVAGDRDPPRRRVRELIVIAGRRSGKDSIASAIATTAALEDYSAHLRPGEKASVLCLAVNREQAGIVAGYVRGYFAKNPLLQPLVARESDLGIELTNDVDVVVATNSYRAVRGRTVPCAIFDEACFWRDEASATPDVETYAAVVPAMVTMPGAILVIITTAYRKSGLAYDKWAKHYGQNDDDVLVVFGPSTAFNPRLPQHVIDDALARDPEAAGAEWLSHWRSDLSDFLDRELVSAAVDPGIIVRPPRPGIRYLAAADPSGGRGDAFTAAIAHAEGGIAILDCLYESQGGGNFDASVVCGEIADLLRQYGVHELHGDNFGAGITVSMFREHGIAYKPIALRPGDPRLPRSEIYLNALPLFTAGRVRLLDHDRLVYQLTSLERRTGRTGRDSVDHPASKGFHDDLANAAAAAIVLAGAGFGAGLAGTDWAAVIARAALPPGAAPAPPAPADPYAAAAAAATDPAPPTGGFYATAAANMRSRYGVSRRQGFEGSVDLHAFALAARGGRR